MSPLSRWPTCRPAGKLRHVGAVHPNDHFLLLLEPDGMKECISGGSFNDVVINTFFGFSPDPVANRMVADPQTARPFNGPRSAQRHLDFAEAK